MAFKYLRKLPSPEQLKKDIPISNEIITLKQKRDEEIKSIFTGKDNRFLMIIGPCSADNETSIIEYVNKLSLVQDKVKEKIVIIPRIYTNKPRTTGLGYKGMNHQPDPNQEPDILEGMRSIRRMHIRSIKESGLCAADEMLYPGNFPYLEDILSYVAIGARSVENQEHRLTASGFELPGGMKNPTSGDLSIMMNAIVAAQNGHQFLYNNSEVETTGNPLTHAILRGYSTHNNEHRPNYHYEDLVRTIDLYKAYKLKNPAIIIDTNHSNSNKKYKEQIRITQEVLFSRKNNSEIAQFVKGVMVESYLLEGSQSLENFVPGRSLTDPCIGWEDTEKLIMMVADNL